jgi:hypothetical protein
MQDPKRVQEAKLKLMMAIETNAPMDEEALNLFTSAFKDVKNNDPCPCGKGLSFKDCCKMDWIMIQRRNFHPSEEPEMDSPGGNGKEDQDKEGIRWFCQIGRNKRGEHVIRPFGYGLHVDPLQLTGELLAAYHFMTVNAVLSISKNMIEDSRRGPGRPALFKN